MRLSLELPQDTIPTIPLEHLKNLSNISEPPEEKGVKHDLQEVEKPPTNVDMPISKELEKRVALTEANIKGLETTIDTRFNKIEKLINNLSVNSKADNPSNLNPVETSQIPTPPVMVAEDIVKRTL